MTAAILVLAGTGDPLDTPPPVKAADRDAFRDIATKVLREPDASKRVGFAKEAVAFAGKATLAQLGEILAEGPQVPPGRPAPREVAGKTETFETFGNVLSGLSFEHDGRVLRYAVDVPASYDGKKRVGVLLDPGHGTGAKSDAKGKAEFIEMYRRHADAAGLSDWLVVRTEIIEQIGAEGIAGAQPEDVVASAFDACFRDLAARFAIDCDRVIVNGVSQTAFWSWYLARANPRRFAAILPMSAVTWEVDPYAANFLGVRIGVLHGNADPICPVDQVRATFALLQRIGADVHYVEVPGAKHEYKVWGKEPDLLKELAATPRALYPKLVSFSLQTLRQPWCGPVRVDELEKVGDGQAGTAPTGGVDVVFEGQSVRLFVEGIRALTLVLSAREIDLSKPIEVTWNGKSAFTGTLVGDPQTLLWAAGETLDWTSGRSARLELHAP